MDQKKCKFIPPIFYIKTDLDPFYLYGASPDSSINSEQDPRFRLATLRAQEQLDRKTDKVESSLDIGETKKMKPIVPSEVIKVRKERVLSEEDVDKVLCQIEETFSGIFSNLISISDNPRSRIPDGEVEMDRALKRSREFESRLKRSTFEGKQQVQNLLLRHPTVFYLILNL